MPLTYKDFIDDAKLIGCEVEAIMAVFQVESAGNGFDPEGFPKTLFEGHHFHKYTKGKYDKTHPHLSYPSWTKQFYGKTWQEEKNRLVQAVRLDRTAALLSASWGAPQILGSNFAKCGFKTAQEFVTAMCKDENSQLQIFTNFIIESGLDDELREKNWARFARQYNGPAYAKNQYDVKMAAAYNKLKGI